MKKAGKPWAKAVTRTTGPATQLTLTPGPRRARADGRDLAFVTATVADQRGATVPRRHDALRFSVTGPAAIIATDNGDPTSFEPFQASERKAFNGLSLVVVKTIAGKGGVVRLRAEAEGLEPAEITLKSR